MDYGQRIEELDLIIRNEILRTGPITFARFMELALYHEDFGYYRTRHDATTRRGDFLTAPETHPVFGALLARFAMAGAKVLGGDDFTVVEQGAGTGALALSFIRYWAAVSPAFALNYAIIEPSRDARCRLREVVGEGVRLVGDISDLDPFTGLFLSNELLDAFPVHRVRRRNGSLMEVRVGLEDGDYREIETPAVGSELSEWLDLAGITLGEGQELEVSPDIEPWMRGIASRLQRGFVLTLDYGYDAKDTDRFPRGTALAHYHHHAHEDYYRRPGRQDLTSHVCWSAVEEYGRRCGFETLERLTQREYLSRWGWKDFGRWLMSEGRAGHAELDAVDRLGRERDGMGAFGVLLQRHGDVEAPTGPENVPPLWHVIPSLGQRE